MRRASLRTAARGRSSRASAASASSRSTAPSAGWRIAGADAELAERDPDVGHHQVDGEDGAAALVAGALIQPAFDDHERAGEEEAGTDAQEHPHQRLDEDAVQEDDARGACGRAG